MKKRTAMLMAAGVVLALFGGSVALSFGLSAGGTAEAGPARTAREEPIVRVVRRTVRVEKQTDGAGRAVQVVTLAAPAAVRADDDPSDDAYEDEAYEDDQEDRSLDDHDDAEEHDGGYEEEDDD